MPLPTSNNYYPNQQLGSPPKTKPSRRLLPFLLLIIWLAFVGWAILNKQNIIDWFKLIGYKAPAGVVSLEKQDTMTPYAVQMLDVNHPTIENQSTFSKNCPNDGGEKTIVLGCYHSVENGIFLLNVTDPRLDGVEQVTAAHEMLHAAYSRLSSSERSKIDALLLNYYNNDLHDPRIRQTLAAYRQTEPGQVVNEMHSIFGTEVANLPPALENYYKRYFTDRAKIAGYAAQYENEFTSRQDQVNVDDTKLSSMKQEIDAEENNLNNEYSNISGQKNQLDSEQSSGNITAYNNGVNSYNSLVDNYKQNVNNINDLIDSYNQLVNLRNSTALIENQLYQELSGSKNQSVSSN